MTPALTRAQAAEAFAERSAERDQIQANLLDLDASFGKRLLAGASLTGTSREVWAEASENLASVWATFDAYSAAVDRAGELLSGARRSKGPLLADLTDLLTGPSVTLTGAQVPLARRQLTGSERPSEQVTLGAAVERMTAAFSRVAQVTDGAESVWNEVTGRLDQIAGELSPVEGFAAEDGDPVARRIGAAAAELDRIRSLLKSDPLSLWHEGIVDTSALDRLLREARTVGALATEVAAWRADADRRVAAVAASVATARAREQEALAARDEAGQKIADVGQLVIPATTVDLASRLAALDALRSGAKWHALASAVAALEKDSAASAERWLEVSLAARALLDRRAELRGLLDAYRAKADRLGAVEDLPLLDIYQRAQELLWSAPCDLAAAGEAVTRYRDAVLRWRKETS
jgi:hypothetical protein